MTVQYSILEEKLDKAITTFFAKEDAMAYSSGVSGPISYGRFLEDRMLIIEAIRAGMPYSFFELIQEYTPFTESDWADFLDISTKSLQRYKASSKHRFKSIHTEKIIEIAEVTKAGLDVFGTPERLKLWFNTPSYALGNLKPIQLLRDSYGKEMVLAELTRINHGILV